MSIKSGFAIEIAGLNKSYHEGGKGHAIFSDLDLSIPEGELVALLGRSGSGKSTLLNLISGIDLPDNGNIRLGGTELARLSESARTAFRRRHIGFVFQAYNLIPTLTVRENLLLPLELNRIPSKYHDQRIKTLLNAVELEDRKGDFPDRLSGGEQQRIAVARALVHDPEIILADEPTGNLDLETGMKILELLERCVRNDGKTLLMATHSQEVTGHANRIYSIRENKLLAAEVARETSNVQG